MRCSLLLLLALLALQPATAEPSAAALTPEQWQIDLTHLAAELPARHINAFARLREADFDAQLDALEEQVPNLSDTAIRIAILKIVASLGDGHTTIQSWGREGVFRTVPLVFYWYKDGVFVVGATVAHRNLLGARLVRVGSYETEQACEKLAAYVPHENRAQLKLQVPNLLARFELLQAIGATRARDSISLQLDRLGQSIEVEIQSERLLERPDWIWANTGEPPLFERASKIPYLAKLLDAGSTVYFRYNQCVSLRDRPFSDFAKQLEAMLADDDVRRLIVDLRNNGGGNSAILDPWIDWLKTTRFNRKGSLYVIIGRRTFSSAILNALRLRNETAATLVGEPTAGKPNHFGEVRSFKLPNSGMEVSYSTKYFRTSREDTDSLLPHIEIAPTAKQDLSGQDPVLDTLLAERPKLN